MFFDFTSHSRIVISIPCAEVDDEWQRGTKEARQGVLSDIILSFASRCNIYLIVMGLDDNAGVGLLLMTNKCSLSQQGRACSADRLSCYGCSRNHLVRLRELLPA